MTEWERQMQDAAQMNAAQAQTGLVGGGDRAQQPKAKEDDGVSWWNTGLNVLQDVLDGKDQGQPVQVVVEQQKDDTAKYLGAAGAGLAVALLVVTLGRR